MPRSRPPRLTSRRHARPQGADVARIPTRIYPNAPPGAGGQARAVPTPGPYQSRERFPDRAANRIQTAAQQAAAKATGQYDADNNVISSVQFTGGTTKVILHYLGRPYVGARVENPVGGYLSYQIVPNTDKRMDATQVQIKCLNTCVADVVVY